MNNIMANNKSFTLIELVLAVFLITTGTLGVFSLIQKTISFTAITSSQLQAAYLSQEGIEIVRNIRDTNWLQERTWDEGVSSSEGIVIFLDGTPSKFTRKITILKPEANKMVVSVEVGWAERDRSHRVTAETELYNWR